MALFPDQYDLMLSVEADALLSGRDRLVRELSRVEGQLRVVITRGPMGGLVLMAVGLIGARIR